MAGFWRMNEWFLWNRHVWDNRLGWGGGGGYVECENDFGRDRKDAIEIARLTRDLDRYSMREFTTLKYNSHLPGSPVHQGFKLLDSTCSYIRKYASARSAAITESRMYASGAMYDGSIQEQQIAIVAIAIIDRASGFVGCTHWLSSLCICVTSTMILSGSTCKLHTQTCWMVSH